MQVQLLFKVTQRTQQEAWGPSKGLIGGVKLGPVMPKQDHPLYEEMKKFYEATPGGSMEFVTINDAAMAALPPGTLVRVTLEPITE